MYHFCIDIDNTVARTDEVMRRVIWVYTNGRVRLEYEDIVTFDYHECRDAAGNQITKPEWDAVHDLFSEAHYLRQIQPMSGVVEALTRLAQHGTIHLATSRKRKARAATVEWLDTHHFPTHDLHFLKHREKHASMKPFTAAVEDDYHQATAFAKDGGTPCFLIRHPWNQSCPKLKNVEWVDDWTQLADLLISKCKRSRRK
jgi:uncharacterized HAD superfamily protein